MDTAHDTYLCAAALALAPFWERRPYVPVPLFAAAVLLTELAAALGSPPPVTATCALVALALSLSPREDDVIMLVVAAYAIPLGGVGWPLRALLATRAATALLAPHVACRVFRNPVRAAATAVIAHRLVHDRHVSAAAALACAVVGPPGGVVLLGMYAELLVVGQGGTPIAPLAAALGNPLRAATLFAAVCTRAPHVMRLHVLMSLSPLGSAVALLASLSYMPMQTLLLLHGLTTLHIGPIVLAAACKASAMRAEEMRPIVVASETLALAAC